MLNMNKIREDIGTYTGHSPDDPYCIYETQFAVIAMERDGRYIIPKSATVNGRAFVMRAAEYTTRRLG